MSKNNALNKYQKKGMLIIEGLNFDHVIPRVARSSGKNICRISLPKELDGKKVYVLVDMTGFDNDNIQMDEQGKGVGYEKKI